MTRIADLLKNFNGENPFKESQARNFSDAKVVKEFQPTSLFWSLFNEQHEVLIGTRGSGKTVLLKMMRYSLLKQIVDPRAKELILSKKMIAVYIPMNMEFLSDFDYQSFDINKRLEFFQFAFNCLLAESFLTEISSLLADIGDIKLRAAKNIKITKEIASIWFPKENQIDIIELDALISFTRKLYYSHSITSDLSTLPPVFIRPIGTPIQSVEKIVTRILELNIPPTWLICIDEAEFLSEHFQRCINTIFRADSRGIVIKMATLPFSHKTRETLTNGIFAEPDGNDFNYRLIDMQFDSSDFICVTNSLCNNRLKRELNIDLKSICLEDFLGKVGNDDLIDYYKEEINNDINRKEIEDQIIKELSEKRKATAQNKIDESVLDRKQFYDKFAPVYFYRVMHSLARKGHRVPGWFAGANMVRRIAQGNPRRFIQIMNHLFDCAKSNSLTPKMQHKVVSEYANLNCESTLGLPLHGPAAYRYLTEITKWLENRVHNGPLIDSGNTFSLDLSEDSLQKNLDWIALAVSYLRLVVDDTSMLNGISNRTTFSLSNTFCVKAWLPMRVGGYPKLKIDGTGRFTYRLDAQKVSGGNEIQISLFEEDNSDDNSI